jgi:hypothetical protein
MVGKCQDESFLPSRDMRAVPGYDGRAAMSVHYISWHASHLSNNLLCTQHAYIVQERANSRRLLDLSRAPEEMRRNASAMQPMFKTRSPVRRLWRAPQMGKDTSANATNK